MKKGDQIDQIELNELIVLSLGFTKMPESEYALDTYIKNGVKLWNKHNDFSILYFEPTGTEIKSVDQLQNLYYALKGEKLKCTL